MSDLSHFQFHPRCKDLRLTHLCFADDLILCCKGKGDSEVKRVVEASGFTRNNHPFKYLGVPLCSKKISAAHCGVLVDKMTTIIKVWNSRQSYLSLIYVLLSLHMYWAQIYILRKSALREIVKIYRTDTR